jgi:hypothetical protein
MHRAATEPPPSQPGSGVPYRSRAFGLELRAGFPVHGLVPEAGPTSSSATLLELSSPAGVDELLGEGRVERLSERRDPDGAVTLSIDAGARGYRLVADGYGAFAVAHDGRSVACAPSDPEPWRWQRYLIGQVLPFASVARGLEVLHASAVEIGGRAVAFSGPRGAGKTSLALRLVQRGARFLADDVVALESGRDGLVAHPGAAVASLRHGEAAAMGGSDLAELGTPVGRDEEAQRMVIERRGAATRLAALYLLDREASGLEPIRVPAPGPLTLLATSFNFVVRTPARLTTQLEVCATLAREVPVFRLPVPRGASAGEAAERVVAASLEKR